MDIERLSKQIKALEYFKRICEAGSYTKAASEMDLDQPYLSKQIRKLENTFGRKLLYRSNNKMKPTPDGEALLSVCGTIDILEAQVRHFMQQSEIINREIRISFTDGVGIYLIPGLNKFTELYPHINLSLLSSNPEKDIHEDKTDVAIVYQYPQTDKNLHVKEYERAFGLFASVEYIKKPGMPKTLDELKHHCLCDRTEYQKNWKEWKLLLDKAGKIITFDSSHLLITATDAGMGITLHPLVYGLQKTNWIRLDIEPHFNFKHKYWLLSHLHNQNSPAIQDILNCLYNLLSAI